jgi:hypothetical protein
MTLTIDSDLDVRVEQEGCSPIVFIPDVNLHRLEDPSIIDSF